MAGRVVGFIGLAAAALLTIASTPLHAAPAPASGTAVPLRPGQFVWYEEVRPIHASYGDDDTIRVVVSIPAQRAYVYRGGALIAISTVSTGRRGHSTPKGEFSILEKRRYHRSNLYSNAPMPFMQRLTWDGIALHAGHLPGYPASHGCIRLPTEFARRLFATTSVGGMVSVIGTIVEDPNFAPDDRVPFLRADPSMLEGEPFNVVTASTPVLQVPPHFEPASYHGVVGGRR